MSTYLSHVIDDKLVASSGSRSRRQGAHVQMFEPTVCRDSVAGFHAGSLLNPVMVFIGLNQGQTVPSPSSVGHIPSDALRGFSVCLLARSCVYSQGDHRDLAECQFD
jgi:hypothetical protein